MNILVLNAGSSSLKYQLINIETHNVLAKGICERVGSEEAFHKHGIDDDETVIETPMKDHKEAMRLVLGTLVSGPNAPLGSLDEIDAIGHRIVQGGKYFDRSVLIDDDVIAKIDELAELAPLHNKAAIMGIEACKMYMKDKPMVAVFDSAYFQTLPPKAYMYGIPYEYYEKYGLRKYGAHGTSHRYVAERAAEYVDEPLEDLKIITCHLGSGCSMAAIDHGVAVDTSMGLTPLDGLIMGTRCGSIDPAISSFIMEHEHINGVQLNDIFNKHSGLLGISGVSNDVRDIHKAAEEGNERAQLAYDMFSNSVKKYIGQYIAVMGGVDIIVLTAGVGENSDEVRRLIFAGLQPLGIELDFERNRERGGEREISTDESEVQILVIPTDEEYMIARDTFEIVQETLIAGLEAVA